MGNIRAVMHWCFDCTNDIRIILYMPPIGHMDWIGFRKLDPCPTLRRSIGSVIL